MGAGASTVSLEHLSAEDVGTLVASIGDKYSPYKAMIVENGISGEVLAGMEAAEMKECLQSIGVTNSVHQTVLCANLKKLKANGGGDGSGSGSGHHNLPAAPASDRKFHPLPADFKIEEKVTKTPKAIMTQLFEIQGIAVDPTDLDPAVDKIAKAVGGGFGDGISRYDCFINYRVAADADLAEKLYLYLRTKGIHAFLDKKCLKNGEKWKDGFLTGLKNSKCFLALISRKALDRVRDKTGDHTYDNVLLEYETALNIMVATNNPQFICPLHVGECNGGTLTKFADFGSSLYPDSVTALPADPTPPVGETKKTPPMPPAKTPKTDHNADGDEEEEEEQQWGDDDGGEVEEEGENEADVLNVPQPEGTKSVYNQSYYCEIKNVRFENQDSELILVVEYNVRGDMSLGDLQDPSSSHVHCGGKTYSSRDIKVYFSDPYQNRGELYYTIPMDDVENFATQKVTFVFGQGGYSAATLVMPNSESTAVEMPLCCSGQHYLSVSDYKDNGYETGYICEDCNEHKTGFRWFCLECNSDRCFSCEPLRVFNPKTPNGSNMERCAGAKYGPHYCDECERLQLQCDPEFYMNKPENYDLCLSCASQQMIDRLNSGE